MVEQYPVLVYGTLRPGGGNYSYFLKGVTASEEDVLVDGFIMLAGRGYPYLLKGDKAVVCTLVTIAPDYYEKVLKSLDHLEGFIMENSNLNHYDRLLHVFEVDGIMKKAWIYVASDSTKKRSILTLPVLESGDWIAHTKLQRAQSVWN